MMLAAQQSFMSTGKMSAKSYIQDGLVAQWDGIENAGYGIHSNDASYWIDLAGGQQVNFSKGTNAYFKDNAFHREAALGNFIMPIRCPEQNCTIEIIVDVQGPVGTDNPRIVGSSDTSKRFEFDVYDVNVSLSPRALWQKLDNTGARISSLNWGISSIGVYRVWAAYLVFGDDGFYVGDSYAQKQSYLESYLAYYDGIYLNAGAWAQTSSAMTGDIYAIRKYSRRLSFDEIAYNYKIDKQRFGIS